MFGFEGDKQISEILIFLLAFRPLNLRHLTHSPNLIMLFRGWLFIHWLSYWYFPFTFTSFSQIIGVGISGWVFPVEVNLRELLTSILRRDLWFWVLLGLFLIAIDSTNIKRAHAVFQWKYYTLSFKTAIKMIQISLLSSIYIEYWRIRGEMSSTITLTNNPDQISQLNTERVLVAVPLLYVFMVFIPSF